MKCEVWVLNVDAGPWLRKYSTFALPMGLEGTNLGAFPLKLPVLTTSVACFGNLRCVFWQLWRISLKLPVVVRFSKSPCSIQMISICPGPTVHTSKSLNTTEVRITLRERLLY